MKNRYSMATCILLAGASVLFYAFKEKNKIIQLPGSVSVDGGLISGVKGNFSDVTVYKGVPFAAPPVGDLRWKAPQPVQDWVGVKKCEDFGPSPMQAKPVPFMVYTKEFLIPEAPISEDCLYLNVWTKGKGPEKRPVFVWIYGGGFSSGGAAVPIYDGEAMANKGIVFVSINYRVGVFGFLSHPELTKESPNHTSGNYGLLDQIAALKWVKRNIAALGGDPDNVTIDGQSAGSMSVNCLVASPVAKGLFHKAIAESGSFLVDNPLIKANNLENAEQQGLKLAGAVNAKSLEELRKVPAEDLMKVQGRYSPIVDGYVLPQPISKIIAEGKQNQVPLITGWNADEAFVTGFKKKDAFIKQAREQYGAEAATFLKYFPAATDEQAARSQIKLSRDLTFALSGYKWAGLQSLTAPVYVYNFCRKLPASPDFVKYGAFHTGEVAYDLDNLRFLDRPWEAEDLQLASMMSAYWVNFIVKGNPNGGGLPPWLRYKNNAPEAMVFNKTSESQLLPDKDELDFLLAKVEKK